MKYFRRFLKSYDSLVERYRTWLFQYRLNKLKEKKRILTRRAYCLELLLFLEGDVFHNISPNVMQSVVYESGYKNIRELIQAIKEFNYSISNQSLIAVSQLPTAKQSQTLDLFFTEDNFYLKPEVIYSEFKTSCLRFLNLLEKTEDSEYGYYEYLGRVLLNVVSEIEDLLEKISTLNKP